MAHNTGQRERIHIPWGMALCILAAIAVFFLWQNHRAHILQLLPYALLLLCPMIHLFLHRGHGDHKHRDRGNSDRGHSL